MRPVCLCNVYSFSHFYVLVHHPPLFELDSHKAANQSDSFVSLRHREPRAVADRWRDNLAAWRGCPGVVRWLLSDWPGLVSAEHSSLPRRASSHDAATGGQRAPLAPLLSPH